ncbi:hypothetical protein [Sorangium sp. So ce341]|uniref:hypothetical protein n=1 Tax=Sorangium sp. So ce341 TaxID=3133302 RepID=UPI003F614B01
MKVQLCAAAVCALFAATSIAAANDDDDDDDDDGEEFLSELEQQAYDIGWRAADRYCQSLIPGPHGELKGEMGVYGTRNITEEFKRACKLGYDNYIDNNLACQQRLEQSGKYTEMWNARNNTCT